MDVMGDVVKLAGVPEPLWRESVERHDAVREEFEGICYYRVTKKIGVLEKGAVVTREGVLFDFPRIARVLHLENGVRNAYSQPFYVEEKVDGYNIRVALIEGRVLAFSRGAYVCPFSTDRVVDFLDVKTIFGKRPDFVVCGEFAGPDNPYNVEHPPYVKEDVRFFTFDLMAINKPHSLPAEERYQLFDSFSMPTVRRFGRFSSADVNALKEIMKELEESGSEGIVMKPVNPAERTLKYVTLGSCLRDMRVTAHLMPEMMSEFFTHRIIRAAMFLNEHTHAPGPEVFASLGEALLKPVYESVARVARGGLIEEKFCLRFREEKNVQAMIEHLYKCKVKFEVLSKNKEGVYWRVAFSKKYYATYEILQRHIDGAVHVD